MSPDRRPAGATAPVVLFDLDDTLMAHRAAVRAGILRHRARLGYADDAAADALDDGAADALWHELEERHYHRYLAGELTFEQQRRARAHDFAAAHDRVLGDDEAGAWFDDYFAHYRESWRLHDDALPALDALSSALPGVRFGIITNGEPDFQQRKLDRLGIADRFDHVIASGALGVTKPDPRIFAAAVEVFAEDAGPGPGAVAYVGDRLGTDALGAVRAGLTGVWLDRRDAPSEDDDAVAAALAEGVHRIHGLDELAPLLARAWR